MVRKPSKGTHLSKGLLSRYSKFFQQPLTWEYEAEKESVMHRVKRGAGQLESTGSA